MSDTIAKLRDLANLLLIEGKREWSDAAEEGAEAITRLTAEVERLKAINALMEYAAFPTSEEAREAEEWIKANPGRPLSDYCSPGGLKVKHLTAEVARLRAALWDCHALANGWRNVPIIGTQFDRIKNTARAALPPPPVTKEKNDE